MNENASPRREAELQEMQEFMLRHDAESLESFTESFAHFSLGMRADSTWVQAHQIVARSATEAIEIAEQNVVNLLITDVIMPDMNGRDLADKIVNLQNETRVLFMSGFAKEVVQRKGANEPDIDFLQKPFSPGDLANRIREILT